MPKAPDQERRNNSETVEARSRTRRPGGGCKNSLNTQ